MTNKQRDLRPDPAAHLWPAEQEVWAEGVGRKDAPDELKARWRAMIAEIDRVRAEVRWPSHHYPSPPTEGSDK